MKKVLIAVAIVLVGWALAVFIPWRADRNPGTQSSSAEERPGEVLKRFFAATNAVDTTAWALTLSQRILDASKSNPSLMQRRIENWKQRHADIDILWDSVDGNVGYVKYHVRETYKSRVYDTVANMQVFKENGQWKVGGW